MVGPRWLPVLYSRAVVRARGISTPHHLAGSVHNIHVTSYLLYLEHPAFDGVSHVLEFSDNTGAEWMARKETPHAAQLQRVAARRAAVIAELGVFVTTARVSSVGNTWADDLSRQRVDKVEYEARAVSLRLVRLTPPK